MKKKHDYAAKLENERINILKEKGRVMSALVNEEKLGRTNGGDKATYSPIGRTVRQLVKGKTKR